MNDITKFAGFTVDSLFAVENQISLFFEDNSLFEGKVVGMFVLATEHGISIDVAVDHGGGIEQPMKNIFISTQDLFKDE